MREILDLKGRKYGRWTVVAEVGIRNKSRYWLCKCECGNMRNIAAGALRKGNTKSCGCLRNDTNARIKPRRRHGMTGKRLYRIWSGMKRRCKNANAINYDNYGLRGISVCEEWATSFEAFMNWALANGYEETLSIDRIDVNGNYCPQNCRWATAKEQASNRRKNRL